MRQTFRDAQKSRFFDKQEAAAAAAQPTMSTTEPVAILLGSCPSRADA